MGRTIELWETFTDTGSSPALRLREITSYVDTVVVPTTPAGSTHRVRLTASTTPETNVKTEVDGHGRPITRTELVQNTAPANHVTTWQYANDGTLQSVSVPDPSVNNSTLVTYNYGFDSLGRATSIRRPDATAAIDKSGVDISYDGVTKTVTEYVGAAGGTPASTKTITDSFGRLVAVHERTSISPLTFAVTNYTYGPDDNVAQIVDPGGVTTQLVHDLGGRRTRIDRHGRSWKYTYDRNGNLTSEQVPGAAPGLEALYTTTIAYDDLDRPASKLIGQRGLSTADQMLFAAGSETFTYDSGPNMVGRLRYWKSFAPGAGTPTITRDRKSDDQGNDTRVDDIYSSLAGFSNSIFTIKAHNVGGMLAQMQFSEGLASVSSTATISYSARGYPSQINFIASGNNKTLGVQTRNIAGLVTDQSSNLATAWQLATSEWTYDKLGRVVSQLIRRKGGGTVTLMQQDLTYFGNDNPRTLAQTGNSTLTYGYDHRHQIVSATAPPVPTVFTSAYQYDTAGRFTNVNISQKPGGSEVKLRNVNYQYGDADPERVTALVEASGGQRYATYQYDEAGNQISRCYGATFSPCAGESLEMVYDGKDQLRRATKKQAGVVVSSEEYWYDGTGSRITVLKRDANGTKAGRIQFLGDMEVHFNHSDVRTHAYVHLSLGTPVARVTRTTSSTFEYMFHGLGNHTIAAVNNSGTLNAGFSYTPFGELLTSTGAPTTHRRRFNDKYHDEVSELSYYGARYFDKVAITWTKADPKYRVAPEAAWETPRRAALYTFTLNNPTRYLDPDGRDPTSWMLRVRDVTPASSPNFPQSQNTEAVAGLIKVAARQTTRADGKLSQLLYKEFGMGLAVNFMRGSQKVDKKNTSEIIIVDLTDASSRNAAVAIGGHRADVNMRALIGKKGALAYADKPGNTIVVSADRISAVISEISAKDSSFDPNTKEGREKLLGVLSERIAHEVGHNLGADTDKARQIDEDEVMYEARGLASDVYKNSRWTQNDISAVSQHFGTLKP